MKKLKVDRTKLVTIKNYASRIGKTPQRVYQMAEEGSLEMVTIDGVKFIQS